VRFYRSITGINGTYNLISTQNLDVDNADKQTIYDDTAGTTAYFYKTTVYHSISTIESDFSDPIPGGGWRRRQVGKIIDEILQEIGDLTETHITRNEIIGYFNDVNDDLTISVGRPYEFLKARQTLTITPNTNYINYPTDSNGDQTMWKFNYIDYNFVDSTTTPTTNVTYTLITIPEPEFRNIYQDNTIDSTTVTDQITRLSLDNSVNRFRFDAPFATNNGTLYLHYWKYFTEINSEGDVIETPTPKIYKLYVKARFYHKRSISDLTLGADAQGYDNDYQVEKTKYTGVNRKDQGSPRSFRPATDRTKSFRRV